MKTFLLWTLVITLTPWVHAQNIQKALKPPVYERAVREREVMVHASLEESAFYHFYMVVKTHASPKQIFSALKNYEILEKVIPFVSLSKWDPKQSMLEVKGGIFKFEMHSFLKFDESDAPTRIPFKVVKGHFLGLTGELLIERHSERDSLVYLTGSQSGKNWPPRFVIERGAEIVLSTAGRRLRSHIEESRGDKQ